MLGLGCRDLASGVDPRTSRAVIAAALDAGITYFDTADAYGEGASETLLGKALGPHRDSVVIATKFGLDAGVLADGPRAGKRYIRAALEASLRRLRTDHVDLYAQHRPDDSNLVEETVAIMHQLVAEGKVRAIGSSHYEPWRIAEADSAARAFGITPMCSARVRYNLLHRQAETSVFPVCRRSGIAVIACSPLAGGVLSGARRLSAREPAGETVAALGKFARDRGVTVLDVALGTAASSPGVTTSVVVDAHSREEILAAADAVAWRPAEGDLRELDSITPLPPGVTKDNL